MQRSIEQELRASLERQQLELAARLITEEGHLGFAVPWMESSSSPPSSCLLPPLRFVGGVDISFDSADPSAERAVASLVVCQFPSMKVVYRKFAESSMTLPYIPGFLAFREVQPLVHLVQELQAAAASDSSLPVPQLILVDGNGMLHPRAFGLACHLGVLLDLPTIGVAKKLFCISNDGITHELVEQLRASKLHCGGDVAELVGTNTGKIWGAVMQSTDDSSNPIFVSVGHRMSLDTATKLVALCCQYRIPEPVRQADLLSRDYLRNYPRNYASSTQPRITSDDDSS